MIGGAEPGRRGEPSAPPRLGLAANWPQFAVLVLVNAFVGAMVGAERSVLPLLARDFGLASASAATSFLIAFGVTKALANLGAGSLVERQGRRRTLLLGWSAALPVPFLVLWAPSWSWIVVANVFLGVHQGLAWSTTVIMKIDLVGPRRRGLAMGLNEFAGYLAVAAAAFASGTLAARLGPRVAVAYLALAVALLGWMLTAAFVRDTTAHARLEQPAHAGTPASLRALLARSAGRDGPLFGACQAGLVNNLNDGVAWGLLPLVFAQQGSSLAEIGWLAAVYPATWGVAQVGTGALSDRWGRKPLVVAGMLLQGVAFVGIGLQHEPGGWTVALVALGIGTALVYPSLLAAVADHAAPRERPAAVGVYRLWRDAGYAVGALLAGALADTFGAKTGILTVAALTGASGLVAAARMRDAERQPSTGPAPTEEMPGGRE
jgi:MFS family permease